MVHSDKVYIGCYDSNLYALDAKNGLFYGSIPVRGSCQQAAIFEDNLFFGSEDYRLHAIFQRNGRLNWTYYTNGPIRSSPFVAEVTFSSAQMMVSCMQ